MLFDEKEMRELCKELGIDIIEENGYPSLNGKEQKEIDETIFTSISNLY